MVGEEVGVTAQPRQWRESSWRGERGTRGEGTSEWALGRVWGGERGQGEQGAAGKQNWGRRTR